MSTLAILVIGLAATLAMHAGINAPAIIYRRRNRLRGGENESR